MLSVPLPAASEPLLPAHIRAAGGVRLRLTVAAGRTRHREVAESGGYRVRFPTAYDETCEAVLINTGGGMAGGDAMRVAVRLDEGADAVVTTQAAEKIYRSQGADTVVETALSLDAGARLAWLPQESILFCGARLSRQLTLDCAADAQFIACEATVFGRAAMGETMLRGALRDRWRIRRGGRLVFADDVRLEGPIAALLARSAIGGQARAAATLVAGLPGLPALLEQVRAILADPDFAEVEGGAGLVGDLLVLRLISPNARSLRRALVTLLRQVTGRALPRTWST